MSTDYEPGTVAIATVRGVEGVRVMRRETYGGGFDWAHSFEANGFTCTNEEDVTDVRPLVVLDFNEIGWANGSGAADCLRNHDRSCCNLFDRLADQIEAQTKPPRIPEPGLWGVVQAHIEGDGARTTFLHHDMRDKNAASWHETGGSWWFWSDLIDPVLIREGVES